MGDAGIALERIGRVAIVTMAGAPVNALSSRLMERLCGVFRQLGNGGDAGAIILTGAGNSFCAGLDVNELQSLDADGADRLLETLNSTVDAVHNCPLPVVAAINGHAIAGGLVLALCCDWRIATKTKLKLGFTEAHAGIPFAAGPLAIVCAELDARTRRELVLFGRTLTVGQALARGIVDESIAPAALADRAVAVAGSLAALPGEGLRQLKRQIRQPAAAAVEAALSARDPIRGKWISDEARRASLALLGDKGAAAKHGHGIS